MPDRTKAKAEAKSKLKPWAFYSFHPWQCSHKCEHSEISAYVEVSGAWETVATIHPTTGANAKVVATFFTDLINDKLRNGDVLQAALSILEEIVQDGLTYSTEHEADHVIERLKNFRARSSNHGPHRL